jgi:CcmD family protein
MDERNFQYMFYGFLAAWLLVVGYLVSMVAREGRMRREIDNLRRMVEDREKEPRR